MIQLSQSKNCIQNELFVQILFQFIELKIVRSKLNQRVYVILRFFFAIGPNTWMEKRTKVRENNRT